MPRKPRAPKAPVISAEKMRRYSTPLARAAARICREVQIEVGRIVHGEDLPAGFVGFVLPDPDNDAQVARVLALTTPAARLAEAMDRGDLDDPFTGWELVMRCARELGPRYVDMVDPQMMPGAEQSVEVASNVHTILPKLTLNGSFVGELIVAEPPAFALGMLEERKALGGMFALHLDQTLPDEVSGPGFRFGHSLMGTDQYLIVHFSFEFYGFARYDVLVNPSSPVARAVLQRMVDTGKYSFIALSRRGRATVFQSEASGTDLTGLRSNWPRILDANTTEAQYAAGLASFERRSMGATLMQWVCRDDLTHLDLTHDRLDLTP